MRHGIWHMAGVRSELFNSIDLEVCGCSYAQQTAAQARHSALSTQHSALTPALSTHQHSALSSTQHSALSTQHSSIQLPQVLCYTIQLSPLLDADADAVLAILLH
jgi:hypothetical protein